GQELVLGLRRHRQDFELGHLEGALADGRADAVGTRVAAADHHDMFAAGEDRVVGAERLARDAPVLLRQEVHGEMNADEVAARRWQIPRLLGAAGQRNRVIAFDEASGADARADMGVEVEDHALGRHLLDATLDVALLELEVGDPVAQQPAGLGVLFVDVNLMAGARELLGAGEARGTRADDGDLLAGPLLRRLGRDPALREGAVDDRAFDRLDRHRRVLNVERAGRFARGGAHTAGEFGEVVGREQIARRLLPVAAVDEVVPVRNLVVDRAAVVTIRDAAVHAARRLIAGRLFAQRKNELPIMANSVRGRGVAPVRPIDFQKTRHLAHARSFPCPARARAWGRRRARRFPSPVLDTIKRSWRPRSCLRLTLRPPASPVHSVLKVPPARAGTRPASPCGTWA